MQDAKKRRGANGLPTRTVLVFHSSAAAASTEAGPAGLSAAPASADDSPRLTGRRSDRKRATWLPSGGDGSQHDGAASKKGPVPRVTAASPRQGRARPGGAAHPRPDSSLPGAGGGQGGAAWWVVSPVKVAVAAEASAVAASDTVPVSPSLSLAAAAAPDGLHYFPADGSSCGALVLPRGGTQCQHVTDDTLLKAATADGAVNCVPGCEPYVVVRTTPDGNCLSHACSLGVWGYHDHDAELRRAVCATMAAPGAGGATRRRFSAALQRLGIPADQWAVEWGREMDAFAGSLRGGRGRSKAFLSDVHCFILANVLRRPLVIYGGPMALAAGLAGVYLPLLWANTDEQPCSRVPTSLLFHRSHFSVLATMERAAGQAGQVHRSAVKDVTPTRSRAKAAATAAVTDSGTRLPLAVVLDGKVVALPVRFLLPEEEKREGELLRAWMDIVPDAAARAAGLPAGVKAFSLPPGAAPDGVLAAVEATVKAHGESRERKH